MASESTVLPGGSGPADSHLRVGGALTVVLDGLAQSGHTAESAAMLARIGVLPPMIVVGVPNVNGSTRNRDLTPPERWTDANRGGAYSRDGRAAALRAVFAFDARRPTE